MWWPIVGLGGSCFVTSTDKKTALKGYHDPAPPITEEAAYELPLRGRGFQERPARKRELFALGSAIYEVMVWAAPYEGLDDEDIGMKYAVEDFPSLEGVPAGHVVQMC